MLQLRLNKLAKATLITTAAIIAWNYFRNRNAAVTLAGNTIQLNIDPIANAATSPNNYNTTIAKNVSILDILGEMHKIVKRTLWQTKTVAKELKQPTQYQSLQNLFYYLINNFKYKNDQWGLEQLREPARAFKDRQQGIDCDCFSILIASILKHWNIPCFFRATCYKQEKGLVHVYPVAKINNQNIALDVVSKQFNYQKPYLYAVDV